MMLYYECAYGQISKLHEELCGDSIAFSFKHNKVIMVLSDGLGSGVKANILATLTTRMLTRMLDQELPLREVVKTVTETLPVCKVRKLAYSTFSVAQLFTNGDGRLVEFDNPSVFYFRKRNLVDLDWETSTISEKSIKSCALKLCAGDWLIFVSDGVISAGIGGLYPLGWGWDKASQFLRNHINDTVSAQKIADNVLEAVSNLYVGPPGDDVTVATIKVRYKRYLTILFGPPLDAKDDPVVVEKLMKSKGCRVVCGGTTANIVSRHIGKELDVDLHTMTDEVPPLGHMEGLDLVTEGVLTMTRLVYMLKNGIQADSQKFAVDSASSLLRMLEDTDSIKLLVGQAKNPAHQDPKLPVEIKTELARELKDALTTMHKECSIEFF
ncbi:MAG: SpoIIE family protein phosphatase [bacterium]